MLRPRILGAGPARARFACKQLHVVQLTSLVQKQEGEIASLKQVQAREGANATSRGQGVLDGEMMESKRLELERMIRSCSDSKSLLVIRPSSCSACSQK